MGSKYKGSYFGDDGRGPSLGILGSLEGSGFRVRMMLLHTSASVQNPDYCKV